MPSTTPRGHGVYVADIGVRPARVLEFSLTASGDAAPIDSIIGSRAGLGDIVGMALDSSGRLYVAHVTDRYAISVFAASARGNVAPERVIQGNLTGIATIKNITVDSDGTLYASSAGWIRVFAPGATGNVAPIATLVDNDGPAALALTADRHLYAVNATQTISIFAPHAATGAMPIDSIAGDSTGSPFQSALAFDPSGRIHAPSADFYRTKGFVVYSAGARGNAVPAAVVGGVQFSLDNPGGMATDASGNTWICGFLLSAPVGAGAVGMWSSGANGDVAPSVVIAGSHTSLVAPVRVAIH